MAVYVTVVDNTTDSDYRLDDKKVRMEDPFKAPVPPTTLSRTLPDSFSSQQFNGVVPDADIWLLHFSVMQITNI